MLERAGRRLHRPIIRRLKDLRNAGEVVHVEDLAGVLDCGRDYIYKAINAGALEAVRLGSQYRIRTTEAIRFLGDLGVRE